jgi:hypothetical protein
MSRNYGLSTSYVRPLESKRIIEELQAGNPIIALVKYDLLSTKEDPNQDHYAEAHFVLIVGIHIGPKVQPPEGSIIYHDPDRISGEEFGAFRETPWSTFIAAMGATSQTAGNSHNYQGMVIYG